LVESVLNQRGKEKKVFELKIRISFQLQQNGILWQINRIPHSLFGIDVFSFGGCSKYGTVFFWKSEFGIFLEIGRGKEKIGGYVVVEEDVRE